jgi:error-prone DNA polymerase
LEGQPGRFAGIVIGRQRPNMASGGIFLTLEDEMATINVIVWNKIAERQRRTLLGLICKVCSSNGIP